ncbi:MAG: hypothetical protein QM723_37910 [Myxococcaceae bacterium]
MASKHDPLWLQQLTRRTALLALGATGAATFLPGCKSKPKTPPPPPGPTGVESVKSLRELVRASPDHLSARAAALIAAKDFSAAVRFVRDNVAVVPPMHSYDAAVDGVRWGPDAALRAGAGTQRERAELLASMLTAMGATAKVVSADRPAGVDAVALYATRPPAFAVDASKLSSLGGDTTRLAQINEPLPDPDPAPVISALLAQLPAGQAVAATPYDGLDAKVPLVEYTAGGVTKWAFALGTVDEVAAMPAGLGSELGAVTYPKVSVRLLAAMGDLPGVPTASSPVELAAGSWGIDQLAGSRLFVTVGSNDPDHTIGAPPDQLLLRVPAISIQRPAALSGSDPKLWSPSAGSPAPVGVTGAPITVTGARFSPGAQASDPPVGPYGSWVDLDTNAHAAALASVASVEVVANGGAFPDVQLTVAALDGSGNPVFGLHQSDFAVADEGVAQAPVMVSNAGVDQLKVLLSYDCSGSVTWPMPADKTAFDTQLSNALVASATATPYLLGVAPVGGTPLDGYNAPSAQTIGTDLSGCVGFSELWLTLGQLAPSTGVSAVVLVSDFQASDDPAAIPALQQRLAASGLAVALVPVSATVDQNTVNALVTTCGAVVLDHTAGDFQQKLTAFISGAASRAKASGYRMAYRVPADQQANQTTRAAHVAVATKQVAAAVPYAVPAMGARGNLGVAGLYLELNVGGGSTITRWLSGPRLDRFGNPVKATPADFAATRALMNGVVTVSLEPGSPTAGASAEDLLQCVLSSAPLKDAAGKPKNQTLALGSQFFVYSNTLTLMADGIRSSSAGPMVTPQGLKVLVMSESAADHGLVRRLDVVPELNRSIAGTTDAAAAFAETMKKTLPLSLRERLVLDQSAASTLSGASLQYLAPSANPSTLSGFSTDDLAKWTPVLDQYTDWHRLVPSTPATEAMWIVDPGTGTTVAVYLDGTGGSCATGELAEAINLLSLYCSYGQTVCNMPTGPFSCDGALAGAVGTTVLVDFAIQPIDVNQLAQVMWTVASLLSSFIPGYLGFALSLASFANSTIGYVDNPCP